MKKNNSIAKEVKPAQKPWKGPITIGMDLGDRTSRYCVLDGAGEVVKEGSVATTRAGMTQLYGPMKKCRIAMEVGTHSPWVSRQLKVLGHEVIVANPRQLKVITESSRKDDRVDAQMLARLARADPKLLRPIRHRGEEAQLDLMVVRARAALVEARTGLVNAVRGFSKSVGERLASCDTDQMGVEKLAELPVSLQTVLKPLVEQVSSLTASIKKYERELEQIAKVKYPETRLLTQVGGVGTLIASTYVLTVEDKNRFEHSRDAGCYVGLKPKRGDSGDSQPQLRITKEGDIYLRTLLVQGAHHILSNRSVDSDLKRWGLKLSERGGKNAKKRAVVAVARKLAVLLHVLWVTGEVYEPLRNSNAAERQSGKKARREAATKDGGRRQSPSPGDCEVAAERIAGRKTDDSVRYRDGSTRSIKRRTPTGTRSLLRSECEWKQGESSDGMFLPGRMKSGASRWSARKNIDDWNRKNRRIA